MCNFHLILPPSPHKQHRSYHTINIFIVILIPGSCICSCLYRTILVVIVVIINEDAFFITDPSILSSTTTSFAAARRVCDSPRIGSLSLIYVYSYIVDGFLQPGWCSGWIPQFLHFFAKPPLFLLVGWPKSALPLLIQSTVAKDLIEILPRRVFRFFLLSHSCFFFIKATFNVGFSVQRPNTHSTSCLFANYNKYISA